VTLEEGRERQWLRPLGLLGLALALAIVSPLALIGVPLALLSFLVAGGRIGSLVVGAALLLLAFGGEATSNLWYLERGWAVVVGGLFVAATLGWPGRAFSERALLAVAGAAGWTALVLEFLGGWAVADGLVKDRLATGAAATAEVFGAWLGDEAEGAGSAFQDAVLRTAELQGLVFPALLALATLAALGVAWWVHVRLAEGSAMGLGSLRGFRFPDPLIWVLIAGIALMLSFGWDEGWGRMGTNLVVFMAGLYALRGAGVLLFVTGGLSVPAWILVAVAAVLAPPLVLAGALVLGMGDSWLDLRARWASARPPDL
jgi:hypothetical protein